LGAQPNFGALVEALLEHVFFSEPPYLAIGAQVGALLELLLFVAHNLFICSDIRLLQPTMVVHMTREKERSRRSHNFELLVYFLGWLLGLSSSV